MNKIIEEQLQWHAKTSQGCIYAAYLGKMSPVESKIKRLCLQESLNEELIKKIVEIIELCIKDGECFMLSLIIPTIDTKEKLIDFIELCKSKKSWVIKDDEVYNGKRLVKIRVSLQEKDETGQNIYSWALGFGNFSFFPKTRRSPYFEISLLVKSKYYLQRVFDKHSLTQHTPESIDRGTTPFDAHLADLYIKNVTDNNKRDKSFWNASRKQKKILLTNNNKFDDTDAKAKITFSYPSD